MESQTSLPMRRNLPPVHSRGEGSLRGGGVFGVTRFGVGRTGGCTEGIGSSPDKSIGRNAIRMPGSTGYSERLTSQPSLGKNDGAAERTPWRRCSILALRSCAACAARA